MNWIKKNLGWVAFFIWVSGTIIEVVANYFFDKDLDTTWVNITCDIWYLAVC